MAGMAGYGWKLLEIAGQCLKWDGLITILGFLGVWDMEIRGLGDFLLGPAQPGLLSWSSLHCKKLVKLRKNLTK